MVNVLTSVSLSAASKTNNNNTMNKEIDLEDILHHLQQENLELVRLSQPYHKLRYPEFEDRMSFEKRVQYCADHCKKLVAQLEEYFDNL